MGEGCGICVSDPFPTSENLKERNYLGVISLDRKVIIERIRMTTGCEHLSWVQSDL
jgi:hypothetical protein